MAMAAPTFSPDFPYIAVADLPAYLTNSTRSTREAKPALRWPTSSPDGTAQALVDLCHVHGIAVMFDVVYNTRAISSTASSTTIACISTAASTRQNNDSLYSSTGSRHRGLAFALWNEDVRDIPVDNARYYVEEFHADGFRYDEI